MSMKTTCRTDFSPFILYIGDILTTKRTKFFCRTDFSPFMTYRRQTDFSPFYKKTNKRTKVRSTVPNFNFYNNENEKNMLTNFYSLVLYGLFCVISLNNLYAQTPKQDFRWVQKPIFESISGDEKEGIVAKLKEPITLYGYADSTGKVVISPKYAQAKEFSEDLAAVEIDRKWGFIDNNTPFKYFRQSAPI
jgi:WG containing repeat